MLYAGISSFPARLISVLDSSSVTVPFSSPQEAVKGLSDALMATMTRSFSVVRSKTSWWLVRTTLR